MKIAIINLGVFDVAGQLIAGRFIAASDGSRLEVVVRDRVSILRLLIVYVLIHGIADNTGFAVVYMILETRQI